MQRTSRLGVFAFALLVAAGMSVAAVEKAPSLDGKSFEVQLTKADAKKGDPDTLTFANGMFDSQACHTYGFGQSVYSVKNVGKAVTFEVRAIAKDRTEQVWNGTVEGKKIHGTMKLTDPEGKVTRYHFKGEAKVS